MPIRRYSVQLLVCLLACMGLSLKLDAAVIDGLFDAKVAVENQSDQNQNKAFKNGMEQVLLKVRGRSDVFKDKQIRRGLTRASRFVRAYSYEVEASQLFLSIQFDQEKIQQLVRTAGFPVWAQRRPDTLVWLAMKDSPDANREIITIDNHPQLFELMTAQAQKRGIELVQPIWDLDDIQNLSVYDIWGGFSQRIASASIRYNVPSILSARIYPYQPVSDTALQALENDISEQNSDQLDDISDPQIEVAPPIETLLKPLPEYEVGQWVADWTAIEDGEFISGQLVANTAEELGLKLIDTLANRLADKYALDLDTLNADVATIKIMINNIDDIQTYVQVTSFLQSLSVVNSATLMMQQGSKATFELSLYGELEDLNNVLNLDSKISPVMDEFGQSLGNSEYFWRK